FAFLQELVRMARTLRAECTITPEKRLRVLARPDGEREPALRRNEGLVKLLAGIGELEIKAAAGARPAGSIGLVGRGFEAFVFVAEVVDTAALRQKFGKDLERDRKFMQALRTKLANEQFVKNAPPELVAAEQAKLEECLKRTDKIESYLRDL
ncbi:MAG: valine--tRNA ligase, partial [Treponema sp.]|nr:valine--tRNA ligase [Treponema sp.]